MRDCARFADMTGENCLYQLYEMVSVGAEVTVRAWPADVKLLEYHAWYTTY